MLGGEGRSDCSPSSTQEQTKERPHFIDLMAGKNMPLARAFRWCGWTVEAFDWSISKAHDLSSQELQASITKCIKDADAFAGAMAATQAPTLIINDK